MNLRETDAGNKLVWLSSDDVDLLLEHVDDTERQIAFELGVRCGLRSHEIMSVCPADAIETDAGPMLVVSEGKGDKYRETPLPPSLMTRITTVDDVRDEPSDEPIIQSISSTRNLRYWIESAREMLAEETGDDRWLHLSLHDLRRTWATALSDQGVPAELALDWGGWSDIETFLEHYQGAYSPAAQRRAREKVDFL